MMIDAPFGEGGVLIFPKKVGTKRTMASRRAMARGGGEKTLTGARGGGETSLGRWRGAGTGGGETNCMVMEVERQGVGERIGG